MSEVIFKLTNFEEMSKLLELIFSLTKFGRKILDKFWKNDLLSEVTFNLKIFISLVCIVGKVLHYGSTFLCSLRSEIVVVIFFAIFFQ